MRYRVWPEQFPHVAARSIEAPSPRSAAFTLAGEMWRNETWEGDEPLRVATQNENGHVIVYPIAVELDARLVIGAADVRVDSNGGDPTRRA